jgi:pSer/pThr/pTyr-binding forkhead associated (FHA) protein
MDETKHHAGSSGHALRGPHQRSEHAIPALRLVVLPEGRPIELTKPVVVVGRHTDVELRLAYPDVSRRHCRLVFDDGVWQVNDLDSLNGIYVNGERMQEATLYEGDRLRIGEVTLLITAAPVSTKTTSAAAQVLRSIASALPPLAG